MFRSTTDLQRLDVFKHLNGQSYLVDEVRWAGGDNYKVICIDNNDDLVTFVCDVHTQFEIQFSYKVGK